MTRSVVFIVEYRYKEEGWQPLFSTYTSFRVANGVKNQINKSFSGDTRVIRIASERTVVSR